MNNEELSFHTPEDFEPPLSPVLTNTKESRKKIFKKSRVKLLNKFSQSVTQETCSGTETNEVFGSLLSQCSVSSIEERMKTINDIRNKQRVIYSVETTREEVKNVTNENGYETIEAKEFSLESMDNSVGFHTGSGKSITISDRAITRAKKIFDDIIDDTSCPESNDDKKFFTAPENKTEQSNTFKIPTLQISKKNKSTQKEKVLEHSPDNFTQISDTQICNAIDEAECIAGVSFSQWNFSPGENISSSGDESRDDFVGFDSNEAHFQVLNTFRDVLKTIQDSCTSLETVISMKNDDKSGDAILDVNFSQFESLFTCESKKSKISEDALSITKKTIDVSEDELRKANTIFDEDFSVEMKEMNSKILAQNSVPNFVGFSTASGKKMNISEKALAKAKSMFEEMSSVDNNKENFQPSVNVTNQTTSEPNAIPVFQGFSSVSGNKLKVSEAVMTKTRAMFEDLPTIPENFVNGTTAEKSSFGGFSTASGRKMEISTEAISKAKMIFADLSEMENTDITHATNAGTLFNDLPINSENYETGINKNTSTFGGFSTASGKKMQISTEAMSKAKMMFEDISETEIKESTVGFSTAAGKKLNISEKALKKAKSMFDDLSEVSEENKTLPPLQGFSTASGKKMQISTEAMSKAKMMFEDISEMEFKDNVGFATATGKKLNISEKALTKAKSMFDDLPEASKENKALPSVQGFSTASGKQLKVSEEALKKAKLLLETEPNDSPTFEGFSRAAGEKMEISKEVLSKARTMFEETSDNMKPTVPEKNIQNISNYSPIPIKIKNVSNISDFTKSPLVSSPIPSTNITPNLKNQSTTNFSTNPRKRKLGLSSCKQIELSENSLKKARLIFEDLDVITPKKLTQEPEPKIFQSTPILNTPLRISPKNTSTPKVETSSPVVYEKDPKTYLSFQEETVTSYEKSRGNFERKYEMLKLEMLVIEDRMRRLEEQRKIMTTVDKEHRSQKPGYVFTAKSQTNRITLKQAVNEKRPGTRPTSFSTPLPKLNPENAPNLHFYTPWFPDKGTQSFPSILRTQDSAVIIPNQNNYVGVSEIESAFLSMPGVDPKLVPDGWVRNHYKWIVWKLGSMERSYPEEFSDCLSIENVMGQLKYRYDREVDRAQRPALRRILERDDAAGKRMVLVVSGVIPTSGGHDLELSDGWYAVRTSIDSGLNNVVQRGLIKIGTKLMIQGAELLNCEGCPPLQVSESVRLKIFYNSTRRAAWYVKLGYCHVQGPLLIPFRSIHNNGGAIGCTRVYVARVYPLCFMEKSEAGIVWRNERAQLRKYDEREMKRSDVLERLQQQVEDELTEEWRKKVGGRKRRSIGKSELEGVKCAKTLYEMMESSIDPDSFKEMLSTLQSNAVCEYQNKILLQKQSEMTMRLKQKLSKFKDNNNASPVLKTLLVDVACIYHNRTFNIWSPTESHISDVKEGNVITLYSITPRNNGTLSSTSRTCIRTEKDFNIDKFDQLRRCVSPIEKILEPNFSPFCNEFDTIGIVVYTQIEDTKQTIWLCDSQNRFLSIKVNEGQQNISFDVKIGSVIAVLNLVYKKSSKDVAEAVANTSTVFTTNPQKIYLKNYMYVFQKELPQDFNKYIDECKSRIEAEMEQMLFRFNKLNPFSFKNDNNNTAVSVGGMGCVEMTLSDEELSLLDTTLL